MPRIYIAYYGQYIRDKLITDIKSHFSVSTRRSFAKETLVPTAQIKNFG